MNFIHQLSQLKKVSPFYLGISTNGTLLKNNIPLLKEYEVDGLNISLDSLDPLKFYNITKGLSFNEVIPAIDAAIGSGINVKINTVVMRGVNDDELSRFADFAIKRNVNVRFIEYMPFTKNSWHEDSFISYTEMKERIEKEFILTTDKDSDSLIAKDYFINGTKAKLSFISSVSDHFCSSCNRLRLTSKGEIKLCLFSSGEGTYDLKALLRTNASDNTIMEMIEMKLHKKEFKHPEAEELASLDENYMKGIGG